MKVEESFMDDDMVVGSGTASAKGKANKKMMTMDDVSECLQKDFSEEIADAKKYLRMAKIADDACAHHDSHYLLEMAKDEYTHACFIHEFMKEHEICIPEEQEKCYRELEEEMAHFFSEVGRYSNGIGVR